MSSFPRVRALAFLPLALLSCRTVAPGQGAALESANKPSAHNTAGGTGVMGLPMLAAPEDYAKDVEKAIAKIDMKPDDRQRAIEHLSHYFAFLGSGKTSAAYKATLKRLLDSSTQFAICDDFGDWACLEQMPLITPKSTYRQDTAPDLGAPITVKDPLALEYFFTEQWNIPKEKVNLETTLSRHLAEKITLDGKSGIDAAMYGIDHEEDTMKPVFDAIMDKYNAGVPVRVVVDEEGLNKKATPPFVFSVVQPKSAPWILDENTPGKTNLAFQYSGTKQLLIALNAGVKSDNDALARIELPDNGIMHNKFVVLSNGKKRSVWSGTANISDTCMGTDRNTNMSIYIKNTEVASVFEAEFEEMFGYMDKNYVEPKGKLTNLKGSEEILHGHFHNDKTPNTKRYFLFPGNVEARVHFAPTDDAEHRVILPMLLNAQPGDDIRVSMFGGGGFEMVRAFQYAAFRGATVRIVFDRVTGAGSYSWTKDASGTVLDKNPYNPKPAGSITVRMSTWKGLNHMKVATITHKAGNKTHAEILSVGSQNWSKSGNDTNDENMVTIRSNQTDLDAAVAFNKMFDDRLWPAAAAGEVKPGQKPGPAPAGGGDDDGEDPEAQASLDPVQAQLEDPNTGLPNVDGDLSPPETMNALRGDDVTP